MQAFTLVAFGDPESDSRERDQFTIHRFVLATWENLLTACSQLLVHCNSSPSSLAQQLLVKQLLQIYVSLSVAAGLHRLTAARDGLLGSLCKAALPTWHGPELGLGAKANQHHLSIHHIDTIRALFVVSHTLANSLGPTWSVVLDTFDQLDLILHRRWRLENSDPSTSSHASPLSNHENDIQAALGRFVRFTCFLTDGALLDVLEALMALNRNSLSMNQAASPSSAPSSSLANANADYGVGHADAARGIGRAIGSLVTSVTGGVGRMAGLLSPAAGVPTPVVALSSGSSSGNTMASIAGVDSGVGVRGTAVPFALRAMIGLAKKNASRLHLLWPRLVTHLEHVATHRSSSMRALAVGAFQDIASQVLNKSSVYGGILPPGG